MKTKINSNGSIRQVLSYKKLKKLLNRDLFHKIADLSKANKRILNYLIYMAQRVPMMYMTQTHIANVVNCSRRWVNTCIKFLVSLGLIISKRRRYTSNLYALKTAFLKPEIARQLYTILSSLRDVAKKFSLVEKERYIIITTTTNQTIMDTDTSKKTQNESPPNVMNMTLAEIMDLRSPFRQKSVPTATQAVNKARPNGFKRLGDCL